jgi:hypothetical protein
MMRASPEGTGRNMWTGIGLSLFLPMLLLKERHGIEGKDEALKALTGTLDAMTDKALE